MAQLKKCLLFKQEDLSSYPQNPCKSQKEADRGQKLTRLGKPQEMLSQYISCTVLKKDAPNVNLRPPHRHTSDYTYATTNIHTHNRHTYLFSKQAPGSTDVTQW